MKKQNNDVMQLVLVCVCVCVQWPTENFFFEEKKYEWDEWMEWKNWKKKNSNKKNWL